MEILKFIFKISLLIILLISKEGVLDTFRLPEVFYTPVIKSMHQFLIFWLSVNLIVRFNQFVYRKRKKLGHKYSDNVIVGLQNKPRVCHWAGQFRLAARFGQIDMTIRCIVPTEKGKKTGKRKYDHETSGKLADFFPIVRKDFVNSFSGNTVITWPCFGVDVPSGI